MEYGIANRKEEEEVGSGLDRISQLPEPILHHILCFLSLKKAVQTSVLSKPWRHLGPSRPVIELLQTCSNRHVRGINDVCENCLEGNYKIPFLSLLENTFQRYHDQNLFPQELRIAMLELSPRSISVLKKWISIFINPDNPVAVTSLHLWFDCRPYFNLPSVVFEAEYLRELHLHGCRLYDIDSIGNVLLKNLQKLSLSRVIISDEALEKVISGCPLVKRLLLEDCYGFKTINVGNKNPCLKSFEISRCCYDASIEVDAPTLESLRIMGSWNLYPNNNYFPHLKSLFLSFVKLSTESFHYFSCNFPRLEEFSLRYCLGCEEINLSSRSIKRLIIDGVGSSLNKFAIEVPNILYFELSNCLLPITTLSLATTSNREWKSHLNLFECLDDNDNVLPRILNLFGLVKALSQSQISLTLFETLNFKMNLIDQLDFNDNPVVLQYLDLIITSSLRLDSFGRFFNVLLRIFRPRYMEVKRGINAKEVAELLWKSLIHDREKTEYEWEQHLEEVIIEASDEKGIVWHHVVQWTCFPEWSENQKFRFRLKWRD